MSDWIQIHDIAGDIIAWREGFHPPLPDLTPAEEDEPHLVRGTE